MELNIFFIWESPPLWLPPGFSDAFHIYTPLLEDTPLTTWVMAPMYIVAYALILLIIELIRKKTNEKGVEEEK